MPKVALGGSVCAGTTVGAGGVALTSPKSGHTKSSIKKGCRIHKLMSTDQGTFEKVEEEELEQEILSLQQTNNFSKIKQACDQLKGEDIFIANRNFGGWTYDANEQTSTDKNLKDKFQTYLKNNKFK
ncbi:hypothetical protein MHF_0617 [Mycoplasma haemofelis Ohio2]|uniref:Uncharacterized protein n=1 Tax=Mycoplasma haemofelis (strain Ohio2) TaxID=859194 RepID=F6FI41_MYCHI|nr:hypothetical protein MHF_0617 [Mycoplasma haemofelis Ohio2]